MELKLSKVVYTNFAIALAQIAKFEAGSIKDFTQLLQKKLDAKRSAGSSATGSYENIVVE